MLRILRSTWRNTVNVISNSGTSDLSNSGAEIFSFGTLITVTAPFFIDHDCMEPDRESMALYEAALASSDITL